MINVFIIILNWNGKEDTIQCLKSIKKLQVSNIKLQVIVVDNGSTDGSINALRKFQISNYKLHIIENKRNLGFAEGNNVGIKYALENKADYILVLNNDTLVDSNLIVRLLEVAEEHRKLAILTPKIYFAKGYEFHKQRYRKNELGKVLWSAGGTFDWKNVYANNRGLDEVDVGQYGNVEKTQFATGACVFLSARALRNVGLFDKRYFMYLEDADLSQRMIRRGFEIYYVPKAAVWHKVGRSAGIGSNLSDYFLTRNRLLFAKRYAPFKPKMAVFRESIKLLINGRRWQKTGARDFYLCRFGKGSWK